MSSDAEGVRLRAPIARRLPIAFCAGGACAGIIGLPLALVLAWLQGDEASAGLAGVAVLIVPFLLGALRGWRNPGFAANQCSITASGG
jgi:hypothetical protein